MLEHDPALGPPPQVEPDRLAIETREQQLRNLIHRWRQAEPKALHLAAAKRLDLLQLLARPDAFGGGRDAEVLGETRDWRARWQPKRRRSTGH